MAGNKHLHNAFKAKNDEFYTQINDIANEMKHYRTYFRDKVVYCNADDPTWSAFWEYFHLNTGGNDADITIGEETPLSWNGDFRNEENIEILKTADIVVTNPPFSKILDFIKQLNEYEKEYLVMGNVNAGANHGVFPSIKQGHVTTGYTNNKTLEFIVPDSYNPTGKACIGNITWYTTLPTQKPFLPLTKSYNPKDYPKYDNFDAINVNKVKDIPHDYYELMGVPITFLGQHNPNQFEIIGHTHDLNGDGGTGLPLTVNGKLLYKRVLIKRKTRK